MLRTFFCFQTFDNEDHFFNFMNKSTFRKTPAPSALTVLLMFNSCPANTSMSCLLQTYHCKHKTRQDVENPQVLLCNGPFSSVHLLQGFLWWLCYTTRGLPNVQALYSSCESPGKAVISFSAHFSSVAAWLLDNRLHVFLLFQAPSHSRDSLVSAPSLPSPSPLAPLVETSREQPLDPEPSESSELLPDPPEEPADLDQNHTHPKLWGWMVAFKKRTFHCCFVTPNNSNPYSTRCVKPQPCLWPHHDQILQLCPFEKSREDEKYISEI